jgi:hypothetical protein
MCPTYLPSTQPNGVPPHRPYRSTYPACDASSTRARVVARSLLFPPGYLARCIVAGVGFAPLSDEGIARSRSSLVALELRTATTLNCPRRHHGSVLSLQSSAAAWQRILNNGRKMRRNSGRCSRVSSRLSRDLYRGVVCHGTFSQRGGPQGQVDSRRLRQFSGCLIGQAVGDALGFVVEGLPTARCAAFVESALRTGQFGNYQRGSFSIGQYSDDTQLARELARSLVERRRFEPADYARRIAALFTEARIVGRGRATEQAASRLAAGVPWEDSGTAPPSAGNGSAMRAAPIGLVFRMILAQ